jgi:hypothetical protein
VLLGINLEVPGEEEMDTSPPPTRQEPKTRPETHKPQAKEEKMEEAVSPEKQEVCWFSVF